ncbi:MAG TPA: ComEA family DNA-binding protein [Candidatus Saccharimonadales bacterium]|nr:ComEA family DNA-binding protein [Candidatus Saccharimonadales bacterium]
MEKIIELTDKYKIPLIIALAGILLIGLSLILPKLNNSKKDLVLEKSAATTTSTEKSFGKKLKVDVSGEVQKPGVYELSEGERVQDAILLAGGFTTSADSAWISKELNLASKVIDGQKIYVQKSGEVAAISSQGTSNSSTSIVNINFATETQLDTLPGIGAVTAGKIISGRPYKSIDELLSKKIVGKATFEKIKGMVSVN